MRLLRSNAATGHRTVQIALLEGDEILGQGHLFGAVMRVREREAVSELRLLEVYGPRLAGGHPGRWGP